MSDPIVQFLLRIPVSVKNRIEEAAKESNRSTNAEALVRLEKSFSEQQATSGMSLEEYKKAAQDVFKETVIAHMKEHDDRREQNLIEMTHRQVALITQLTAEIEALRKKETPD
jgi:DNA-binding transcriptional regulator YbjK